MSIRQQVRDAIIFELNLSNPTDVPLATRRRWVPGSRLIEPMLAVFFLEENVQPAQRGFPVRSRSLIIGVQAAAAVQDPAEADDAVEPMLMHVADVLGDTSLSGLATDTEELSTSWGTQQADLFYVAAMTRWRIGYQTALANPRDKQ